MLPYIPRAWKPFVFLSGLVLIILASSLSLSYVVSEDGWKPHRPLGERIKDRKFTNYHQKPETSFESPSWDSNRFVLGDPTPRFRDNLRNDSYYITAWPNAGFTNQFMGFINLIYLAILAERVPVMPPFAPDHHISKEGGILPFGEVFNLTHLRSALRIPILEWKDIKELPSSHAPDPYDKSVQEDVGCWSTRPETSREPHRADNLVHHLGLDPSYTRVPSYTRRWESDKDDSHLVFGKLAPLFFPRHPIEPPTHFPVTMSSWGGKQSSPDERLTCIDILYYMTSSNEAFEWRCPWAPAWNFVGKHVTFNWWLIERSKGYLRKAFLLEEDDEIPPFIAIHIRRGDFTQQCSIPGHCIDSVGTFARAVKDMEQTLLETKGMIINHRLITSDEIDPGFWEEVSELGWVYFNHKKERTLERLGEWRTPLVDIVAHSLAAGFVGTSDSTFSLVSGRRVEDWNNGTYLLLE